MVDTRVTLCTSGYEELSLPLPRTTNKVVEMPAMTDSGAMLVVGGMNLVHSLGMTKRELIPLATAVNVANNSVSSKEAFEKRLLSPWTKIRVLNQIISKGA